MEAAQTSHSRAWLELKAYTGHTATWESKREGTNTEAMRKGLELKLMADCCIELNSFMFPNSCELLGIVISRSFYKTHNHQEVFKKQKEICHLQIHGSSQHLPNFSGKLVIFLPIPFYEGHLRAGIDALAVRVGQFSFCLFHQLMTIIHSGFYLSKIIHKYTQDIFSLSK